MSLNYNLVIPHNFTISQGGVYNSVQNQDGVGGVTSGHAYYRFSYLEALCAALLGSTERIFSTPSRHLNHFPFVENSLLGWQNLVNW